MLQPVQTERPRFASRKLDSENQANRAVDKDAARTFADQMGLLHMDGFPATCLI